MHNFFSEVVENAILIELHSFRNDLYNLFLIIFLLEDISCQNMILIIIFRNINFIWVSSRNISKWTCKTSQIKKKNIGNVFYDYKHVFFFFEKKYSNGKSCVKHQCFLVIKFYKKSYFFFHLEIFYIWFLLLILRFTPIDNKVA